MGRRNIAEERMALGPAPPSAGHSLAGYRRGKYPAVLTGQSCYMDEIICLARDQGVPIIEDSAKVPQAVTLAEFSVVIRMRPGTKYPGVVPFVATLVQSRLRQIPADTSSP